ncbi:hypothetical protein MTO96_040656 [Rhipicephalus appendiculatus]
MPQLTTPEPEELVIGLNAPKTPPKPTTLFPFTEEDEQHWSCFVDGLPELQLQQQEQTQQHPPPVLQQHVTSCPNVSDSSASASNPSFRLPSSPEHSTMDDYVNEVQDTDGACTGPHTTAVLHKLRRGEQW